MTTPDPIVSPGSQRFFIRILRDPAVRVAVVLFLLLRILTAVAAFWVVSYQPPRIDWASQPIYYLHDLAFTAQEPLRAWFEPWYRWDTGWYIHIAYGGYRPDDGSIIFGPLYPFLIKLVAPLTGGDFLVAGVVISNVCCLIMFILLYKLVADELGSAAARETLLLLLVFPAAFYFVAAYTESLFMTLLLGSWLAVHRRHYLIGGVLATLAALTRSQAWVLVFPYAYIVLFEHRGHTLSPRTLPGTLVQILREQLREPPDTLLRAVAVLGGPLGAAMYLFGMQKAGLGSVSELFESPVWNTQVVMPWDTLIGLVNAVFSGNVSNHDIANIAAFLFAVVLTIVATRSLKPQYALYVWPTLLFILMRSHYLIQLHGMVRYTVALFPVFMALGLFLRGNRSPRRAARILYIVVGAGLQVWLVVLFAAWLWVS